MSFKTADLCDQYPERVQVCAPGFSSFGGRSRFSGVISTLKCFEDNSLVREAVGEPGAGRVLVVDAGGSQRCAMLGDLLAAKAVENGWAGVLMYGMIRDSVEIACMELGVMALGTHPRKSEKRGEGQRDLAVTFAGVRFAPGQYLYADEDGILCSQVALLGEAG
jgi:regulator of ribonuclease activity A